MFVVNYDAMYWKARALDAEAELDELRQKHDEAIDTSLRLAQASSENLLRAILAGGFDNLRTPPEPVAEKDDDASKA